MAQAGPAIAIADFQRWLRWLGGRGYSSGGWRAGDVETPTVVVFGVERRLALAVPLVSCSAACGFPSPADDYLDRPLDFNELIVENPAATFAVRVAGESMIGAGIFPGDIAVVNRARDPVDGCIVPALIDGEFTIKRYRYKKAGVMLLDLVPAAKVQASLFAAPDNERSKSRMLALDGLTARYGRDVICYGSTDRSRAWKMKRENLSPRYTTCWAEMLCVK